MMKVLMAIIVLSTSAAARPPIIVGIDPQVAMKGVSVSGVSVPSSNIVYADWTGINAMTNGAIGGGQIGTTAWAGFGAASIVDSGTAACDPGFSAGEKGIEFDYNTSGGTLAFGQYIYLDPAYAPGWQYNSYIKSSGVFYGYKICETAATQTYLSGTGAQIKAFMNRGSTSSDWAQASDYNGFVVHVFGALATAGNMVFTRDDGGAEHNEQSGLTTGITIKGYMYRDPNTNLGTGKVKANGAVMFNCNGGGTTNCPSVGGTAGPDSGIGYSLANAAPNAGSIQFGMRYFQCPNSGCGSTTIRIVIAGVKVCNFDCVPY